MPALSLTMAFGLVLMAHAYAAARLGQDEATLLFWSALLAIFVLPAGRLASRGASRAERIGLVAALGLALFMVKLLHSPLSVTFYDEFAHWRTANDIAVTGRLFSENPLLQVSALFPGLEIVTNALASMSGLPIFAAGMVILGVGRLVLVVALYLFFEQVSRSARVAAVGTVVYMANPNFVFFDGQYAYESLGLGIVALVLYAIARRMDETPNVRIGMTMVVLAGLGAMAVTHHLTAYAATAFLTLWAIVEIARTRGNPHPAGPVGVALLAIVVTASWLVYIAVVTLGYLAPYIVGATGEVAKLIAGDLVGRQLFRGYGGQVAPVWEQAAGFGSVLLLLAVWPAGLLVLWRRYRHSSAVLALGLASVVYPASLGFRLTPLGAEGSNRAAEFLFLGLGLTVAVAIVELWLKRCHGWWRPAVFAGLVSVVFVGGVVVGWPSWGRLPGPFLVSADTRSIEWQGQGMAAAQWAKTTLGPDHRMASDRINSLYLASYGEQRTVTLALDKVNASVVFFSTTVTPEDLDIIRRGRIQYLVVDRRLTTGLPLVGIYFEPGEPDSFKHDVPMDPAGVMKFDAVPGVQRVFDSGDIVVYDVGVLRDAQ
jgi:hypothetical protein